MKLGKLLLATIVALGTHAAWAADPAALSVYTYNAFTSKWGPGPAIKKAFEAECTCRLDFVAVDDAVALLNRLKLEGAATRADIVLGLDMNLIAEARATGLFAPHGRDLSKLSLPVAWSDQHFVPFDYGYFAVVYDRDGLAVPPASLKELIEGDAAQKLIIQDPRTSTPGLGFLLWVKSVYGDQAETAWKRLRGRILTVTKGWSESYGLFTKGEAPMVLSYTTSPAYHMISEKKERYQAAAFAEGHYLQIEVAGRIAASKQAALAEHFMAFVLAPGFQDVIPTGNWMFPVATPSQGLPAEFDRLVKPVRTLLVPPEQVLANRRGWTEEWLRAMAP
ncbi:MAG: thiamine ABC transporter substrate binding subunit [Alphaproteobacteria bacterium]|nr:thiamine ABC transporter substrate binding subunit [Alphaproteobacteria bacterium]